MKLQNEMEIFSQDEEIFSRLEKISAQTQGMKNEIMKFLGFSKIWR